MNHLQVFSHLYFGTNIFYSTFLKNSCRFGNFITACMQKTQNKCGHSPSTRENILIFHQNPLQHPISALSASHVIIYCVYPIRRDFHSAAWVMPRGETLGYRWGLGSFFPKFNQIWCVSYPHEWHMHRLNFLGPGPLWPWGGIKNLIF